MATSGRLRLGVLVIEVLRRIDSQAPFRANMPVRIWGNMPDLMTGEHSGAGADFTDPGGIPRHDNVGDER